MSDSDEPIQATGSDSDEPVLSRKQARKKAQGKLKGKTEENTETPARSQYSVWIGNLNWKTSEETLKRWLSERLIAEKGEITRLHLPPGKGPHDANKGYAYVDFDSESLMEAAIKLSESNLEGRKLLIKRGNDFGGRPAKPGVLMASQIVALLPEGYKRQNYAESGLSKTEKQIAEKQKNPPCTSLFLGNLPFDATVEALTQLFAKNHTKMEGLPEVGLKRIRLGTFEDSGKCKGWAFADFETTSHAVVALLNPRNLKFQGKTLKIEFASEDAVRRGDLAEKAQRRKERREALGDAEDGAQNTKKQSSKIKKRPSLGVADGEPKGKKIKFDEDGEATGGPSLVEADQQPSELVQDLREEEPEKPKKRKKIGEAADPETQTEKPPKKAKKSKSVDEAGEKKSKKRKKAKPEPSEEE